MLPQILRRVGAIKEHTTAPTQQNRLMLGGTAAIKRSGITVKQFHLLHAVIMDDFIRKWSGQKPGAQVIDFQLCFGGPPSPVGGPAVPVSLMDDRQVTQRCPPLLRKGLGLRAAKRFRRKEGCFLNVYKTIFL